MTYAEGRIFGDVLCNGGIDAVDALAILRYVAGLPPLPAGIGCPDVGEEVATSDDTAAARTGPGGARGLRCGRRAGSEPPSPGA